MYASSSVVAGFCRVLAVLSFTVLLIGSPGAQETGEYVPQRGQEGKDVIWLPTENQTVEEMMNLAKVTPEDLVIDLGSGDGRTVMAAARRGAKAIGIEYNSNLVEYARKRAAEAGFADKTEFRQGDVYVVDFSNATVLAMFLLPSINVDLRPKILDMKPGTRVVTNTFTMGDWKPDASTEVTDGCTQYCTAHLWYVPARIEGFWVAEDGTLDLKQSFQMLAGNLQSDSAKASLDGGKVKGMDFSFRIGGTEYEGRLEGDALVGTKKPAGGTPTPWRATRKG